MEKPRVGWVDATKGIGILLVMFGHLDPPGITYLIYSFHMPLFFILSGVVFGIHGYHPLGRLISKKFKSLIVPYLIVAPISYLMWAERSWNLRWSAKYLVYILYGNGTLGIKDFNFPLWFLPCLFVIEIGFGFLVLKLKKPWWMIICAGCGVLGWVLSKDYPGIKMPFSGEVALSGIALVGLGHTMRGWLFQEQKKVTMTIVAVVATLIGALAAEANWATSQSKVDMAINFLGNPVWFYIGALSGSLAVIFLAKMLYKHPVLNLLGKNSMQIFMWHNAIFQYWDVYVKYYLQQVFPKYWEITVIYSTSTLGLIGVGDLVFNKLKNKILWFRNEH